MHVRVAWEIYHHQQKGDAGKPGAVKTDLLRPPTHLFSPSVHHTRPHDLPFPSSLPTHRTPAFDQGHPGSLFTAPPSHIGKHQKPPIPPTQNINFGFSLSQEVPFLHLPVTELPVSHRTRHHFQCRRLQAPEIYRWVRCMILGEDYKELYLDFRQV